MKEKHLLNKTIVFFIDKILQKEKVKRKCITRIMAIKKDSDIK